MRSVLGTIVTKKRLYQILLASTVGLVVLVGTFNLIGGLFNLAINSPGQCEELMFLLCAIFLTFMAGSAALVAAIVAIWLLLRRMHIDHAFAVSILGSFIASLSVVLYMYVPLPTSIFGILSIVIFIGSFIISDQLLNRLQGKVWVKLTLILPAILIVIIVSMALHSGVSGVGRATQAQELQQSLKESTMTVLVPPSDSQLPQPYAISREDPSDLSKGVTIELDGGPGAGLTLYEYRYTGPSDPTTDCLHIYEGAEETGDKCELSVIMPSGTKVYKGSLYTDVYFVVKHGTIAFLSISSTTDDEELRRILDQLEPVQVDALLQTLHNENQSEY